MMLVDKTVFGNPEWKADEENTQNLVAPPVQCSVNQPKSNERQVPKQLEITQSDPLYAAMFLEFLGLKD